MHDKYKQSALLIALIVFHGVLLISPVVYSLGFKSSFVVPGTAVLLLLLALLHDRKIPAWVTLLVLCSLITSCLTGIYWESLKAALLPAYFGVSMLTVATASNCEMRRIIRICSAILLFLLVGGWVAVALALSGVSPLDTVFGLHGRVLYFYFTTLTPIIIGDFIRPAGIYDEPGALSFVVCVIAFLRHIMGMSRRFTWALLTLGFVTFSLAHLAYVTIHFFSERRIMLAWTNLVVILCASVWVLSSIGLWEIFDTRLLDRLSVSSDSEKVISGDNRSGAFYNAVDVLANGDPEVFLFGIDGTCIEGSPLCGYEHPRLGFNPLTPLVHFGILISWPYYLFLAIAVIVGMGRRSWWPLVAIGLLFMQRPELFSAGYSMLAALTLSAVGRASLVPQLISPFFVRSASESRTSKATVIARS